MVTTPVPSDNARGEEELLKQGWTRQFLASGSRLQEASESYASIGLEVHLEPAQAKDLACSECQPPQPSATVEGWYVIYTRPKVGAKSAPNDMDDLW
ncbi:MAG: hypothetical protein HYV01_24450 [Deltaproteobacteria bacterium]|nr:hypothetical protein [Deltaproteobacteria bacterium]